MDEKNTKKAKKGLSIHLYIAFWALVTIPFSACIGLQAHKYTSLAKEEDKYTRLIEAEQKRETDLIKDKDYYESDAFVEKIAREQLGFIHADETLFYNDAKQY